MKNNIDLSSQKDKRVVEGQFPYCPPHDGSCGILVKVVAQDDEHRRLCVCVHPMIFILSLRPTGIRLEVKEDSEVIGCNWALISARLTIFNMHKRTMRLTWEQITSKHNLFTWNYVAETPPRQPPTAPRPPPRQQEGLI